MVNYDKWDTLEVSDDEEDTASRRATVRALDAPSRVTFGGGVGKTPSRLRRRRADVVTLVTRRRGGGDEEGRREFFPRHRLRPLRRHRARDVSDDEEEAREYYEDGRGKRRAEKNRRCTSRTAPPTPAGVCAVPTADETARQRPRDANGFVFRKRRRRVERAGRPDAIPATAVGGPVSEKKNNGAVRRGLHVVTDEGGGHASAWSPPPGTRARTSPCGARPTESRWQVTAKREGKTERWSSRLRVSCRTRGRTRSIPSRTTTTTTTFLKRFETGRCVTGTGETAAAWYASRRARRPSGTAWCTGGIVA